MVAPSEAAEKPVWYRVYVLCILLLLCICNLATRNLPSYLIIVPVPECESICNGVTLHPLCGKNVIVSFPTTTPTRYQLCQMCRAKVVPMEASSERFAPHAAAGGEANQTRAPTKDASASSELLAPGFSSGGEWSQELPPPQRRRELVGKQIQFAVTEEAQAEGWPFEGLERIVLGDADPVGDYSIDSVPWANSWGQDATFYNMADGACLYHWEYGILIGFGFAVVFAIGSVFAGHICDRRSRVVIATAALMVWSVATCMQAAAHSFMFLLLFRAIIGLAQAFAMPAAISITADYFTERQNVAVAVLSVGLYLGSGCASFSILFAEALGWRWAVLLAGLIGIVLTPVLYHTLQEPERTMYSSPCPLQVVVDEVFEKSRVARMLTVAASCKMLAAYSLSAFLPVWYSRRGLIGYTFRAYACWNALVISSGGVLSALLGDMLGHRWSQRDSRAPCWIGLLGSIAFMPLVCVVLLTTHFSVSMISFFLLLFISESWFGPTVALLQASVRRSVRGQAVSLFLVASTLVANVGPAIVGIFDPGGDRIGLHLLWITLTANVGAGSAFMWTAREISVDPVAAGFGAGAEDSYRESLGNKAGTAHWGLF